MPMFVARSAPVAMSARTRPTERPRRSAACRGESGQAASFLLLLMQGHLLVPQHIAYHIVLGLLASGGERAVNRAHIGADAIKRNGAL